MRTEALVVTKGKAWPWHWRFADGFTGNDNWALWGGFSTRPDPPHPKTMISHRRILCLGLEPASSPHVLHWLLPFGCFNRILSRPILPVFGFVFFSFPIILCHWLRGTNGMLATVCRTPSLRDSHTLSCGRWNCPCGAEVAGCSSVCC